jgi:hypothetical protein
VFLLDSSRLQEYLRNDWIVEQLQREERAGDEIFIAHRWLKASPAKRLMYDCVYHDFFECRGLRILDVGGSFCSLSRALIQRHIYSLLELAAHDPSTDLRSVERAVGKRFWIEGDWYSQPITGTYDVIVANDLFPNVDQRLELFIEKFLPACREMRLSLTYYNHPRFYLTKRVDGEEILCMLAWNGRQTGQVLAKHADRINQPTLELLEANESVFENGRQVCIVRLRGAAA